MLSSKRNVAAFFNAEKVSLEKTYLQAARNAELRDANDFLQKSQLLQAFEPRFKTSEDRAATTVPNNSLANTAPSMKS